MIEYFLLEKFYNKEKYTNEGGPEKTASTVSLIIGFLISSLALYLSWTCNTAQKEPTIIKILYGFFAFIFGTFYLILYALFFRSNCKKSL
jgi:uncharacterized membrane protein